MKRKMRKIGLFTLFALILASPIWAEGWWITWVDTTIESGVYGTSIVLGSLDIPHIAYCRYGTGEGLIYARFNPADSSWVYEFVFDSAGAKTGMKSSKIAGTQPSLQLDSKGYPHISFWWGDLGYAWKDSAGWHTTHPYPGPWIKGTALVLDKNDYPHIVHEMDITPHPPDSGLVLYTYWTEGEWKTEVVDTILGAVMDDASITLDGSDCVHISYGAVFPDEFRPGIGYARRDSNGNWYVELIDTTDITYYLSGLTSIAIDDSSRPCIAYYSRFASGDGDLKYAVKKATGWCVEKIDTVGNTGWDPFLCFDQHGNSHIAYGGVIEDGGWLKHAWFDGNCWYVDTVDRMQGSLANYSGLAIDRNDYAHIIYCTPGCRTRYAKGYGMGVEEFSWKKDYLEPMLKVYPNPFMGYLNIHSVKCEVEIYDLSGRLIGKTDNGIWNGRDSAGKEVQSGIYFLRAKGYQPVKVVKLK